MWGVSWTRCEGKSVLVIVAVHLPLGDLGSEDGVGHCCDIA